LKPLRKPRRLNIESSLSHEVEEIAREIIDAAYKVHKTVGPGLLESVYEKCLVHELQSRGLKVESQKEIPFQYDGANLDLHLRLDVLIENTVIVELKSVENMIPVYDAQIISYLKLTKKQLGFLINFNVPKIKDGIKRFINQKNPSRLRGEKI
jgi:GxxExxY protein